MSTISVLITALALAMDAMSLSIYQGIASTESQKKQNFLKICLICYLFIFRTYDVKRSLEKRGNGVWWKRLRF